MKIYNVQINPELAQLEIGFVRLVHTNHARIRAQTRKMPLPAALNIQAGSVVEAEAEGRQIKKLVVRIQSQLNPEVDYVYVLWHQFRSLWTCLSCYQNRHDDLHSGLKMLRKS